MSEVNDRADQAHARYSAARWQIARRTARDLVRDAEATRSRPALAEALSTGAISPPAGRAIASRMT